MEDGADVLVVAPALCEDLAEHAAAGRVTWRARDYLTTDLDGAWLVHTATGDRAVDDAVAADAEAARLWCVRADDASASSAWTPAVARSGDVIVAVGTGGDPRRAVALRNAVALLLDTGGLPLRHHRPSTGRVTLVGGGPGDPGLITTRGRRALAEADVVVVDRLAPRALLAELDPAVEIIEAGKSPHAHTLTQTEINAVLVERAQAGHRVVRLKGGDPFVLGRGGEEVARVRVRGCPRRGRPRGDQRAGGPRGRRHPRHAPRPRAPADHPVRARRHPRLGAARPAGGHARPADGRRAAAVAHPRAPRARARTRAPRSRSSRTARCPGSAPPWAPSRTSRASRGSAASATRRSW